MNLRQEIVDLSLRDEQKNINNKAQLIELKDMLDLKEMLDEITGAHTLMSGGILDHIMLREAMDALDHLIRNQTEFKPKPKNAEMYKCLTQLDHKTIDSINSPYAFLKMLFTSECFSGCGSSGNRTFIAAARHPIVTQKKRNPEDPYLILCEKFNNKIQNIFNPAPATVARDEQKNINNKAQLIELKAMLKEITAEYVSMTGGLLDHIMLQEAMDALDHLIREDKTEFKPKPKNAEKYKHFTQLDHKTIDSINSPYAFLKMLFTSKCFGGCGSDGDSNRTFIEAARKPKLTCEALKPDNPYLVLCEKFNNKIQNIFNPKRLLGDIVNQCYEQLPETSSEQSGLFANQIKKCKESLRMLVDVIQKTNIDDPEAIEKLIQLTTDLRKDSTTMKVNIFSEALNKLLESLIVEKQQLTPDSYPLKQLHLQK